MAHALVQFVMHHDSNLPEDDVVNTFHFDSLATPFVASEADAMIDDVVGFYTGVQASTKSVANYLSDRLSGSYTAKAYNLGDPTPRVPLVVRNVSAGLSLASSGVALPQEVALCVSYKTALVSGTPAARRRGRIYIGPLQNTAADSGVGDPAATFTTTLRQAARALRNRSTTDWVVYSPTDGTSGSVTDGWVDNAWDTQRRRGKAPTSRLLWDTATP